MSKYHAIMGNSHVHLSTNSMDSLSEGDTKVYFYVRLIGNIDKYFVDSHFKNDDYIKMKKQQIENMNKAEMIEQIIPFNKK